MNNSLPLDQQFYMVVLCQGKMASGEDYWAYLKIHPSKAKAFKKAQKKGAFQLEEYGEVIEWGKGADVPDSVKARMEEEGANHQFEEEAREILLNQCERASKRNPEDYKAAKPQPKNSD
ncbi:MAG: hypothetical protein MRY32_06905 [Rickettsiales bacterium]|nr:hypothetical protein [Rickettsiales bacterium]